MATKKKVEKKIGNYQFAYKFTDADGNETIGISTPADFAIMSDWIECERHKGEWNDASIISKGDNYHILLVAKRVGLVENDEPTSENIFSMLNKYEVEDVTGQYRPLPN